MFQSLIGIYLSCNSIVLNPFIRLTVSIPNRDLFKLQLAVTSMLPDIYVSIPNRDLFKLQLGLLPLDLAPLICCFNP